MTKNKKLIILVAILGVMIFNQVKSGNLYLYISDLLVNDLSLASVTAIVKSPFTYNFSVDGTLHEVGELEYSTSPYFWLNSGGKLILQGGVGKTVQGELSINDKWRYAYAKSNPVDTDNGYHPQNLFRLVTRSKWENYRQQVYFNHKKTQLSDSPNRNASNGVLLMSRYKDGNNLYYAGIRVDGYAVIKKKINGKYYTLAYKRYYDGVYNRDTNANLLPINKLTGIRSEIKDLTDGTVSIKLYVSDDGDVWRLAAESIDDNNKYGQVIKGNYSGGIRSDFMDLEFDNYTFTNI